MSIVESFWIFVQSTAVSLPCSVHNFKTIRQLRNKLWANVISRDLSSRCVMDGYPMSTLVASAASLYRPGWRQCKATLKCRPGGFIIPQLYRDNGYALPKWGIRLWSYGENITYRGQTRKFVESNNNFSDLLKPVIFLLLNHVYTQFVILLSNELD